MKNITSDFEFVILPPPETGGTLWYGYMVHDNIPDLDEVVRGKGTTAAKCAAQLERKLRDYVKGQQ